MESLNDDWNLVGMEVSYLLNILLSLGKISSLLERFVLKGHSLMMRDKTKKCKSVVCMFFSLMSQSLGFLTVVGWLTGVGLVMSVV